MTALSSMTNPSWVDADAVKCRECDRELEEHLRVVIDGVKDLCPTLENEPLIDAYILWLENKDADLPDVLQTGIDDAGRWRE